MIRIKGNDSVLYSLYSILYAKTASIHNGGFHIKEKYIASVWRPSGQHVQIPEYSLNLFVVFKVVPLESGSCNSFNKNSPVSYGVNMNLCRIIVFINGI